MKRNVTHPNALVKWSLDHPRLVYLIVALLSLIALAALPFATIDTNPKNMLPPTSDVRMWNTEVDQTFDLYEDVIVVGVRNTQGVINRDSLQRIRTLTEDIQKMPGVAARDVTSLATVDNITTSGGGLEIRPLLKTLPTSQEEERALRQSIFDSDLFVDRLISADSTMTAIYVPLEPGANGKDIADTIRGKVDAYQGGQETFYIVGDPVARDTFGAEMFKLMAILSPIAGGIMCLVLYAMFRSIPLVMSMMAVAMASIVWSLGGLIALGYPIHIMSSMAPVFLMAIATDSIHIFNEFYFRYSESPDRRTAIEQTMEAVARPVKYTALATAAGFAVLLFMEIVPVKVFGGLIVFGTLSLRFLSFSLIPAILMRIPQRSLDKAVKAGVKRETPSRLLQGMARTGIRHPWMVLGAATTVLLFVAGLGMSRIVVNNNQLEWFTAGSEIRSADRILNESLGGTALGYIVATGPEEDAIKRPDTLKYLDALQGHIEQQPEVGRTFSVVDYIKRIHQVLHDNQPEFHAIPNDSALIGQYLFLLGMSARPADLNNVVDYPFQRANIWVQLKTWDAQAMENVSEAVAQYQQAHPFPLDLKPAGTAHFNVIWNEEVLWDMVRGFVLALIAVFFILIFNFGSWRWALLGYLPLFFTIALIYGVIGWSGKDFDMPVSVLSCLSLGMAVDFSIHFISRFRQRLDHLKSQPSSGTQSPVAEALLWTAGRPGKGILRNAILFAAAFSVMLTAPLTPYITVGAFIVSMMLLSALATLLFLPALITLCQRWLVESHWQRTPTSTIQETI